MKIFFADGNAIALKAFVAGLLQYPPMVVEGAVGVDEATIGWLVDEADSFDAIVMSDQLGGQDGIQVLKNLRRAGCHVPVIIMLEFGKARMEEAFAAGADDVHVKPGKIAELVWRIRAVVRRRYGFAEPRVVARNLVVHLDGRNPIVNDAELRLTSREAAILECLALRLGRVASRELLHEHLYGLEDDRDVNVKTIDVHICHLRKRLTQAGAEDCIETVSGRGYRLVGATMVNVERSLKLTRPIDEDKNDGALMRRRKRARTESGEAVAA